MRAAGYLMARIFRSDAVPLDMDEQLTAGITAVVRRAGIEPRGRG